MIAQLFYILSLSLVNAHCGQLVEPGKLKSTNGERINNSPKGWEAFGQSVAKFALPLGDWRAPERYSGMNEKEAYNQMIKEGKSVRELFNEVIVNQKLVEKQDVPFDGYKHETCGYFDPTFQVELDENTNPQSSTTGNNHHGPAEVWIDDVRTHHTSNLLSNQPEVVARSKYNCNKDWCQYRWYWIVFRADQKTEAFQMWVNCAMIKGNGKNPVPVKPTGIWVKTDSRHSYAKNKPGLPVSIIPSETVDTSYQPLHGVSPPAVSPYTKSSTSLPIKQTNPQRCRVK